MHLGLLVFHPKMLWLNQCFYFPVLVCFVFTEILYYPDQPQIFCVVEGDFESLTLLPLPTTSGLSVYLGGHSISVHTCQSTSCFKWLFCIPSPVYVYKRVSYRGTQAVCMVIPLLTYVCTVFPYSICCWTSISVSSSETTGLCTVKSWQIQPDCFNKVELALRLIYLSLFSYLCFN